MLGCASRVGVLAVGYLAVVTIGFAPSATGLELSADPLLNLPARFDAGWYGGIALDGYSFEGRFDKQQNVAFFPAMPLLMRAVGVLAGAFATHRAEAASARARIVGRRDDFARRVCVGERLSRPSRSRHDWRASRPRCRDADGRVPVCGLFQRPVHRVTLRAGRDRRLLPCTPRESAPGTAWGVAGVA